MCVGLGVWEGGAGCEAQGPCSGTCSWCGVCGDWEEGVAVALLLLQSTHRAKGHAT